MTLTRPSRGPVSSAGAFGWRRFPNEPPTFHGGIDFVGAYGSPIRAVQSGTVVEAAPNGTYNRYGNLVVIRHDDPSVAPLSLYAHMSKLNVRKGQKVKAGQIVGAMGNLAATKTEPRRTVRTHLHFELLQHWPALPDVGRIDPTPYLSAPKPPAPTSYALSPEFYAATGGTAFSGLDEGEPPNLLVMLAIFGGAWFIFGPAKRRSSW